MPLPWPGHTSLAPEASMRDYRRDVPGQLPLEAHLQAAVLSQCLGSRNTLPRPPSPALTPGHFALHPLKTGL